MATGFCHGDRVVKYRHFSNLQYCAHGGDEEIVPLGTCGVVTKVSPTGRLSVYFDNGPMWEVNEIELKHQGKGDIMDSLKDYYARHQDALLTLAVVLLVDYFMFEGVLRSRVSSMLENMLGKVEKDLGKGK